MSLATLPTELQSHCAQYLEPSALYSLSRVSVRLYHVAQSHLYRHLSLADTGSLPCVLTLARNTHIARHVRSFAIRLPPTAHVLRAFYSMLSTALSNMTQLTSLDICVPQEASWIMNTRDDATFHRLRHFSSSFHLDANLAHFLCKTKNLVELHVDSVHDNLLRLHIDALPRLAQFSGSSEAAHAIVPGRPVQDIHLTSGDLTEDLAEALANSTAPVHVLAAATSSHSVSLINTLTRCMEHLVHLRIVTTYNFSDIPDTTYFSNISDALTSLPDLQSCEIWGLHWISSQKSFHDQARVWESELFNTTYIPPNNLLTNGAFLDDLYSDLSFAY